MPRPRASALAMAPLVLLAGGCCLAAAAAAEAAAGRSRAAAFVAAPRQHVRRLAPSPSPSPSPATAALRYSSREEGEGAADASAALFEALRARRAQLTSERSGRRERWVRAQCQSSVRLACDDRIRRVDLRRWPVAAVGSANGAVAVANLETGSIVARADGAHSRVGGNPNLNAFLHGEFDGGGTLAVALKGDSVVSAGREGGARAWRLDADGGRLVDLGAVQGLRGKQVTALAIDAEGKLWAGVFSGTYEGSLYRYDLLDPKPLSEQDPDVVALPFGVLSMAVSCETSLVACGTAGGTAELVSMELCTHLASWDVNQLCSGEVPAVPAPAPSLSSAAAPFSSSPPPGGRGRAGGKDRASSSTHVRSVEIFQAGAAADAADGTNDNWCIVAGGGDGTIKMRWLRTDPATAAVVPDGPFDHARSPLVLPRHNGMVVSLTGCRQNGLLLSGAQDGTLRVLDFCDDGGIDGGADGGGEEGQEAEFSSEYDATTSADDVAADLYPIILYQLAGYKVWLSSVCVDEEGLRIVTDGAESTVVVHDFSPK